MRSRARSLCSRQSQERWVTVAKGLEAPCPRPVRLSSPSCAGALVPGRVRGTDACDPGRRVVKVDSATVSEAEELRASPPIFPSPTLDRLTRAHPATPALVFLPAVCFLGVLAVQRPKRVRGIAGRRRRIPVLDALRVLGTPHRLSLRTRKRLGRTAALDDPRRPPRSPERSTPPGAATCLFDPARAPVPGLVLCCARSTTRMARGRRVLPRLRHLRHASTSPFTTRIRRADSGIAFANCICATTSKTTSAASASAPPGGTSSSAHARAAAQPVNKSRLRERPCHWVRVLDAWRSLLRELDPRLPGAARVSTTSRFFGHGSKRRERLRVVAAAERLQGSGREGEFRPRLMVRGLLILRLTTKRDAVSSPMCRSQSGTTIGLVFASERREP